MATALPFHRAVVSDPAFAAELHGDDGPFTVHTRWIETEFGNDIAPSPATAPDRRDGRAGGRRPIVVEVGGKRLEVSLPAGFGRRRPPAGAAPTAAAGSGAAAQRGGARGRGLR